MKLADSSAAKVGTTTVKAIASSTSAFRQFMCYDTLTISTAISGTVGVEKNGSGNLTLTAANTYTGVTTIKNGTLALTGAANRLPITSAVVVGDTSTTGKLVLGNTTAATNQTLASLASTGSGGSVVGGNTANSTLTLAVPEFGSFTFAGKIGGSGTNENRITLVKLGIGELTLTGNNTYTGGTSLGSPTINGAVIAEHNNAFGTGPITMTSNFSTLLLGNGITISNDLTVGAQANNKYLGLLSGATSATYAGNIVNSEEVSTNFNLNASTNGTFTVSGIISSGVATAGFEKLGAGTVVLTAANTYTGLTTVTEGRLLINNALALGTGPVTVNTGGTLDLTNVVLNKNLTLNGGTLAIGGGNGAGGFSGTINLTANSIIVASGSNFNSAEISAAISGAGGITQNGSARAGATRLTGANTYTGPTVINNGALIVKSSLYGNDTSKWTPANITVASNAVLGMSVGGAGEFTMTQAATMFTNLTSNVNNNGMRPNSFMSLDTRNAPAGIYTYSAILKDSTGGGGAVNFSLFGTTTTTLELTGANTYSGVTMIQNNGTLRVSSFNSVNGGNPPMTSSSLGRPTTVDNGTIYLGEGGWNFNSMAGTTYQSGNLTYTGTGETTDRKLFLGGYSGNAITRTYTIDQSGTGLLKFTSNIDQQIGNTNNILILTGSTIGTGEISGVITQNTGTVVGTYDTRVTKEGTGTWTLSGANTYTGLTRINGGLLIVPKTNGAVTATATFSQTTLSVSFNTAPSIGQTFTFFAGPTFNTYGSVSLTGATGRSATYNSTTSTLTIS
jgi:autotransporter-associated beta strand protein